jgi:hypothetical protein
MTRPPVRGALIALLGAALSAAAPLASASRLDRLEGPHAAARLAVDALDRCVHKLGDPIGAVLYAFQPLRD